MNNNYYVYFMSNKSNSVLYVGITNDLVRRVAEHKAKVNDGFTSKYNANKLVYFELISNVEYAIAREKQIKNWRRKWKDNLINSINPTWEDLSESIGVTDEIVEGVKEEYGTDCGTSPQ